MSIAVLKYFIQQRKEEAAASGKKRGKGGAPPPNPEVRPPAHEKPAERLGAGSYRPHTPPQGPHPWPAAPGAAPSPHTRLARPSLLSRAPPPANPPTRRQPQGIRVLEAMAASGLRALRYASEVEGIASVVANDLDPAVVEAMARNVQFTGGEAAARVQPRQGDARIVMLQVREGWEGGGRRRAAAQGGATCCRRGRARHSAAQQSAAWCCHRRAGRWKKTAWGRLPAASGLR
jgi:tRNA G26 N,N-dimethylase Trm1